MDGSGACSSARLLETLGRAASTRCCCRRRGPAAGGGGEARQAHGAALLPPRPFWGGRPPMHRHVDTSLTSSPVHLYGWGKKGEAFWGARFRMDRGFVDHSSRDRRALIKTGRLDRAAPSSSRHRCPARTPLELGDVVLHDPRLGAALGRALWCSKTSAKTTTLTKREHTAWHTHPSSSSTIRPLSSSYHALKRCPLALETFISYVASLLDRLTDVRSSVGSAFNV